MYNNYYWGLLIEEVFELGLLSKKDNDLNAGQALEKMMNKFDIDLEDEIEEVDKDSSERNKRRQEKSSWGFCTKLYKPIPKTSLLWRGING